MSPAAIANALGAIATEVTFAPPESLPSLMMTIGAAPDVTVTGIGPKSSFCGAEIAIGGSIPRPDSDTHWCWTLSQVAFGVALSSAT